MNLNYTEEQLLLRASAERFLAEQYTFASRQSVAASAEGFSRKAWAQFADLGWLALPLPESVGGLGGAIELGILMEAFGGALVLEPYVATLVLGAQAVIAAGDAGQQAAILPGIAEGRTLLAFAHGEKRAGNSVETTASRAGVEWRLAGRKATALGGAAADFLIVSARISGASTDRAGVGLFVVPAGAAGVTVESYALADGSRAADVALRDVVVGADALLGGIDDALPIVEAIVDRAVIALASDALGALTVLLDATVEYAKTRVQFGQPIGKFQALQHRMAEMAVLREEARAIALFATLAADAPPALRARAASAAKVKVGRAARHIAEQAVQLHGAMGVTEELNIGAYLKRILVFNLLFGSIDHHLRRYAALARDTGFIGESLVTEPIRSEARLSSVA